MIDFKKELAPIERDMLETSHYCNRFTRTRFNERLIHLITERLAELSVNDIDRPLFSELLVLLMDKKPYDRWLLYCGETYFIDTIRLMENRVRNSFSQPLDWHYGSCKREYR